MQNSKSISYQLMLSILLIIISGCSTRGPIVKTSPYSTRQPITQTLPGIYHSVKKGETLWRISQDYSVDLHKLAAFNKISNTCKIEIGQKIFIPDNLRQRPQKQTSYNLSGKTSFIWPYKGQIVSCFKQNKSDVKNLGIDLAAREDSSINASCDGIVVFTSENMRGYGKAIIIQHADNFSTVYTHNKDILVKQGEYVKQGQIIAHAGSTGRTSRCLVHFELRKNNKPQNPLLYLP